MTSLRQQMIAALQLSGKSERTQQSYVREVWLLAQFYRQSPDLISEPQLQHYVLHRKNVDGLSPSSMRICYSALRFLPTGSRTPLADPGTHASPDRTAAPGRSPASKRFIASSKP